MWNQIPNVVPERIVISQGQLTLHLMTVAVEGELHLIGHLVEGGEAASVEE